MMLRIRDDFDQAYIRGLLAFAAFVLAFVFFAGGTSNVARAQHRAPKTFPSAEEACAEFIRAVQEQDQPALVQILGPTAKVIISGGDDVEDTRSRRQFIEKYREMHRLVREADGTTVLYIGAENWPVPLLFVRRGRKWSIDPVASHREVVARRIGRNELETIEVCRELVNAQNEYYADSHDGAVKQFAVKFLSHDGRHDGLYWKMSVHDTESPVGASLTLASFEDAATQTTKPRPFHGYYFRILTRQGPHAPGGTKNYIINGSMTGGFAFVAYPAEYRSSGVMTFIVSRDGIVYQKDLGPKTALRAQTLTRYDPDATWKKVE